MNNEVTVRLEDFSKLGVVGDVQLPQVMVTKTDAGTPPIRRRHDAEAINGTPTGQLAPQGLGVMHIEVTARRRQLTDRMFKPVSRLLPAFNYGLSRPDFLGLAAIVVARPHRSPPFVKAHHMFVTHETSPDSRTAPFGHSRP